MNTVCHKQLYFESLFGKQVAADFDGGHIISDAGGLLLQELDEHYGLTAGFANSLFNSRHPSWVIHELKTLVKQRIFSIALATTTTMIHRHCAVIRRSMPNQVSFFRHMRIWPHHRRCVGLKTMSAAEICAGWLVGPKRLVCQAT